MGSSCKQDFKGSSFNFLFFPGSDRLTNLEVIKKKKNLENFKLTNPYTFRFQESAS